jgi:hypothetical protein
MIFLDVTEPTLSYFAPIITAIIGLVAAVISAATPFIVHALVTWLKNKKQIEISEKQEADIARALRKAINITEQTSRKKLKLGEAAPDGAKKMEATIEKAQALLKESGISDIAVERLTDEIEAHLGEMQGPVTLKEKDDIRNSYPPPEPVEEPKKPEKPKKLEKPKKGKKIGK